MFLCNNNKRIILLYFICIHILTYICKYKKCYPKEQYSLIQGAGMEYFNLSFLGD